MKTLFDPEQRFAVCGRHTYMFDGKRVYQLEFDDRWWIEISPYTDEKFEEFISNPEVQEVYEDPIRR